MSVTRELLDTLKATYGKASDYKAAQLIGVSQPTMTKYNKNELFLSPEKVILICKLTDLDPEYWVLRLYAERAERANSTDEAAIINKLITRMAA